MSQDLFWLVDFSPAGLQLNICKKQVLAIKENESYHS
jgi:hypothetical protein